MNVHNFRFLNKITLAEQPDPFTVGLHVMGYIKTKSTYYVNQYNVATDRLQIDIIPSLSHSAAAVYKKEKIV